MHSINPLDAFYAQHDLSINACLDAMKGIILAQDPDITHEWKYGMPFFCYKGKMFCYLWVDKKLKQPYLGLVEGKHLDHPSLQKDKRARMKIMLIDPAKDLPLRTLVIILRKSLNLYKTGVIKIKK